MKEKIVVTLTSWTKRIGNLPVVLGTILSQTIKPDVIVLNLSSEEFPEKEANFPTNVRAYLEDNNVRVNWVHKNTRIWKKILPTFELYPDACIICIDDDRLYPQTFIESLWNAHLKHPNNPISSANVVRFGSYQHCGWGTLDKVSFYGDMLKYKAPTDFQSSDTYFNYWAQKSGHPVIYNGTLNSETFSKFNEVEPNSTDKKAKRKMWDYCIQNFGEITPSYAVTKGNKPRIFYSVPFDSDKNIGAYYNRFAKLVPESDYLCFIDADTLFTTPDYGLVIEQAIMRYPDVEAFTCCTNRVGCSWQVVKGIDTTSDDIRYHRKVGENMKVQFGTVCVDRTNDHLFSGLFLVIKKSAWTAIGGAKETCMLGVDNNIHKKLREKGLRLYQMKGLYLYHWYRGGNRYDTSHLI